MNISSIGGHTPYVKRNTKTILQTWSLMITDEILMKVVNFTNVKISAFITSLRDNLDETDKKTNFRLTFLLELKVYFGIFYVRAAMNLNGMDSDIAWCHYSSNPLFVCTLQQKRFSILSHFIQFDDVDTRFNRWKNDKFACFRDHFQQQSSFDSSTPFSAYDN